MSGFINSFFGVRKKNISKKSEELYKKDSFLGEGYEVCDVIGEGGFGMVYLVRDRERNAFSAVKILKEEYAEDAEINGRFFKEVQVWMDLGHHPYLVEVSTLAAHESSLMLSIWMEYVVPDKQGLNSLEKYLNHKPPDLVQSLRWAIQFCYGMEYAYSRGIRCHRDIKPANILITKDKTVKISDFGLADILGCSKAISEIKLSIRDGKVGLSGQTTMEGTGFGTPAYMPPEQFYNADKCDQRSDIYSFGIVLYQMVSAGKLPFKASLPRDNSKQEKERFWKTMYMLHSESTVARLNSPLFPVIQRCLEKKPENRYQNFEELKNDLETLLKQQSGEVINPPTLEKIFPEEAEERLKWIRRAIYLCGLNRYDEAIGCYDKLIQMDPLNPGLWHNKGTCFYFLGRNDEFIRCLDKALEIAPNEAGNWRTKGEILVKMGQLEEAFCCFNRALEIDPNDAIARQGRILCKSKLNK